MGWREHWLEARRHRDDPDLDPNDYVSSLDLSDADKESLLGSLILRLPDDSDGDQETRGPVGLYEHYLRYLANKHGSDVSEAVDLSIRDTRMRMDLRHPPTVEGRTRTGYGLVLGRIQSGKTAHLVGLACHSMDPMMTSERYNIVIVLSGLIEDLRIQTYDRLEECLDGFEGETPAILPGVDRDLSDNDQHTMSELRRHLRKREHGGLFILIKKNHEVLRHLLSSIIQCRPYDTNRVIIIDDEADHASIDTSEASVEQESGEPVIDDPSVTNRHLRQIINYINRSDSSWYIGYTATPFANLLTPEAIESGDDEWGLSLCPRDFIHSLPEPSGHIDNQHYFTRPNCREVMTIEPPEPDTEDEEGLLRELILRHLATDIIKEARGIVNKHHTTLIHTSVNVLEHKRIAEVTRDIRDDIATDTYGVPDAIEDIRNLVTEYSTDGAETALSIVDGFSDDPYELSDRLERVSVVEVNARQRSDEEESPKNLRYGFGRNRKSYIAVGGTRLSRGLTLEGLTTTLFTRRANVPRYDTMMQMARWCGYRSHGDTTYSDLIRIITTEEIRSSFRDIALAEAEVRHKIETIPPGGSPLDDEYEIWIPETPGTSVTAPEKMQHVRRRTWGRMGTLPIWSYKSPLLHGGGAADKASAMFASFRSLVSDVDSAVGLNEEPRNGTSNFVLARGVPAQWVREFVKSYRSHYKRRDRSKTVKNMDRLVGEDNWQEYDSWVVALHTPRRIESKIALGDLEIGLINRSKNSKGEIIVINNSHRDVSVDLAPDELRKSPLLLLYLMNHNSTQFNEGTERVYDESVTVPVPLFGVCMPQTHPDEGGQAVARGA